MKPIEDLLDAFQQHYTTNERALRYTRAQRDEMVSRYAWVSTSYMAVLYDEVVTVHPMSLRSLPDMAVISGAMQKMDRPEVYATSVAQIEDKSEPVYESIRDAVNSKAKAEGELNHRERERIRGKVRKGEATPAEAFWVRSIDENGGDWMRAVKAEGRR